MPINVRALLFITAMSTPALAVDPPAQERAAASFEQARAAFRRRDFVAAAAAFEQAARYVPHPVAWLDAAEAWGFAGEPVKAAIDYDRVASDPAADPKFRDEALARLRALKPRIATVVIQGDTGVRVALDQEASFDLPGTRRVTAGPHELTVYEPGRPPRKMLIEGRLGETTAVDVPSSPRPAREGDAFGTSDTARSSVPREARRAGETTRSSSVTPSVLAFGLGGIGLVATTVLGFRTLSAREDYDRSPTDATRDTFYRERLLTNLSLGVTAAALGTGVVLLLARRSPSPSPRVAFTPTSLRATIPF